MGLLDRDYTQWKHSKRYKEWARSSHPVLLHCPLCSKESLFWNWRDEVYECLNVECRARGNSIDRLYRPHRVAYVQGSNREAHTSEYHGRNWTLHKVKNNKWLLALLLIFSLFMVGLGISIFAGNSIPIWLLLGFSVFYSIEKWFRYYTRKYKWIGKIYRLLLNLGILSLFGYLIWSGVKLFSHQVVDSPLVGSLLFIFGFAFFIYMWRVVAKNSWRWPSMKLTVFSLICLFLVFSFAGVQPMANYKNKAGDSVTSIVGEWQEGDNQEATRAEEEGPKITTVEPPKVVIPEIVVPVPLPPSPEISEKPTLRNPSWEELKTFLWEDKTDQLEYVFPTFVCEDFAKTLQTNAKKAGLGCAFANVKLKGYPDWFNYGIPSNTGHALNAFETTDRGLVYIDCTGLPSGFGGPGNCDKIIDAQIGGEYIPRSVFPNLLGWHWVSMGTIVDIDIIQW